jgi:penicillin-binding protein 1C
MLFSKQEGNKVVRGGSTLTQVIRLSRNGRDELILKIIELILATRLELGYSKNEIFELYASHAPFGGNVVGLEMASWRYFGCNLSIVMGRECNIGCFNAPV